MARPDTLQLAQWPSEAPLPRPAAQSHVVHVTHCLSAGPARIRAVRSRHARRTGLSADARAYARSGLPRTRPRCAATRRIRRSAARCEPRRTRARAGARAAASDRGRGPGHRPHARGRTGSARTPAAGQSASRLGAPLHAARDATAESAPAADAGRLSCARAPCRVPSDRTGRSRCWRSADARACVAPAGLRPRASDRRLLLRRGAERERTASDRLRRPSHRIQRTRTVRAARPAFRDRRVAGALRLDRRRRSHPGGAVARRRRRGHRAHREQRRRRDARRVRPFTCRRRYGKACRCR